MTTYPNVKLLDMTLGSENPLGGIFRLPADVLAKVNSAREALDLPLYPETSVVKVTRQSGCERCVLDFTSGFCISRCNANNRTDDTDVIFLPLENPNDHT